MFIVNNVMMVYYRTSTLKPQLHQQGSQYQRSERLQYQRSERLQYQHSERLQYQRPLQHQLEIIVVQQEDGHLME